MAEMLVTTNRLLVSEHVHMPALAVLYVNTRSGIRSTRQLPAPLSSIAHSHILVGRNGRSVRVAIRSDEDGGVFATILCTRQWNHHTGAEASRTGQT